jgi:hypothetical protein
VGSAVLAFEPGAERGDRGGTEVVVERVGGERDGEFVAQVAGERGVGGVARHEGPHFRARPLAPFRIVQVVGSDELGPAAGLRPCGDERVPVAYGRVPLQAQPAVDHVLEVVGNPGVEPWTGLAVPVHHPVRGAELLETLEEQRPLVRLFPGRVARPQDHAVLGPGPQGARIGRGGRNGGACGEKGQEVRAHGWRLAARSPSDNSGLADRR